jgi:phage recombination protein Bet
MYQYSESELKFIQHKNKLNDIEMDVFMAAAHRYGLNPLANQIYPQVRTDRKTGERQMVIATGIDGYRTLADRTGCYAGNDDPVFDEPVKAPQMATVTVYKVVGGVRCPFSATARWEQYVPSEALAFMWRKMPHLMLGKVAEALALRKAFPAAISGIYTVEEMHQAGQPINAEAEAAPATSQVKPPPQRAVPEEKPKQVRKVKTDWDHTKESPKEAFVRMVKEWSGLDKAALMDKCKAIMSAHFIRTDGKAEGADFLCCIQFCEKYSKEMSVSDAIDLVTTANKEVESDRQEEPSMEDAF